MMLKLSDISFRYDKDYIFHNLNIDINNGLTFIIGNNNSGKSTLYNILGGMLPYEGDIFIDNKDIKRYDKVMFLSEDYINRLRGKVSKYLNGVDDKVVEYLEVEDYVDSDLKKLTIDLKIKICLAMAIDKMDVIIIDNMLCWLSKNDRIKVLKKLKSIGKKKIIVVFSNNMEDLIYSNRIILLDKGLVVMNNSRDEFFLDKKSLEKFRVSLPFLVDLSYNLKLYNIVDDIYYDIRKLVDAIWK